MLHSYFVQAEQQGRIFRCRPPDSVPQQVTQPVEPMSKRAFTGPSVGGPRDLQLLKELSFGQRTTFAPDGNWPARHQDVLIIIACENILAQSE